MDPITDVITPMDSVDPLYSRGLGIYPGDVIRIPERESTADLIVMDYAEEDHGYYVYDCELHEPVHITDTTLPWNVIADGSIASYWQCVGRKSRTLLVDGGFRTYTAQAHLVLEADEARATIEPTICVSWGEYPGETIESPSKMSRTMNTDVEGVCAEIRDPSPDSEMFPLFASWRDDHDELVEMLDDFAHYVEGMYGIRLKDTQIALDNMGTAFG